MNSFITKLEYDNITDEYLLILPEGYCDSLGWQEGDEVVIELIDGKLFIQKDQLENNV